MGVVYSELVSSASDPGPTPDEALWWMTHLSISSESLHVILLIMACNAVSYSKLYGDTALYKLRFYELEVCASRWPAGLQSDEYCVQYIHDRFIF